MGIVNKDVFLRDAVFAYLDNLQAEAFLHDAIFIVLSKDERLAMSYIYGVFLPALFAVYGIISTIVEYHAVLQNLAY